MRYLLPVLLVVVTLSFGACNNENEHLDKLIPSDVAGVVCINVPNVLEKSGIKQGDDLVIPDQLKAIINKNDDQMLGQIVKNIPNLGVEIKDRAYLFFPNDTFDYVALVAIDDEDKAKTLVSHKTGAQFEEFSGLDCVLNDLNVWCIDKGILFYGRLKQTTEKNKAIKWVKKIYDYKGECVSDLENAKDLLNTEKELTAYIDMQRFGKHMRSSDVVNSLVKNYPVLQLMIDSDIKALTLDMAFNKEEGEINANIIMDDNGEFATMMKTLLQKPSNKFLKAIPNTMSLVMTLSVNGKMLIELPQVKKMVSMVNNMPFLGRLNLTEMIEAINGPIAVSVEQDPVFADEYNYVFTAQTTNPKAIIETISGFASSFGQDPELYEGEHIYAYNNKQVRVGVIDDVVYVKMLNYEQTEPNSEGDKHMGAFFSSTPMGAYYKIKNDSINSSFSFGLTDMHNANGKFVTASGENALLQFMKFICSIKPISNYDGVEYSAEEDNMIGDFQAF